MGWVMILHNLKFFTLFSTHLFKDCGSKLKFALLLILRDKLRLFIFYSLLNANSHPINLINLNNWTVCLIICVSIRIIVKIGSFQEFIILLWIMSTFMKYILVRFYCCNVSEIKYIIHYLNNSFYFNIGTYIFI